MRFHEYVFTYLFKISRALPSNGQRRRLLRHRHRSLYAPCRNTTRVEIRSTVVSQFVSDGGEDCRFGDRCSACQYTVGDSAFALARGKGEAVA